MPAGFNKRLIVWEVVQQHLKTAGETTMADLFRVYKEQLREAYAEEWEPFEGGKRPTRTVRGVRHYLKPPPKGMTYLSFARYMNRFLNEGKIEKVMVAGEPKRGDFVFASEELHGVLQAPVYYKLV